MTKESQILTVLHFHAMPYWKTEHQINLIQLKHVFERDNFDISTHTPAKSLVAFLSFKIQCVLCKVQINTTCHFYKDHGNFLE